MVYCVLFTIELEDEENVKKFLEGFQKLQRFVLQHEPGTLTYELHHAVQELSDAQSGTQHPTRFTVLERYSCQRDFEEVHLKSQTFAEFFALVKSLQVVGEPQLVQLSNDQSIAATTLKELRQRNVSAPSEAPQPLVRKGVLVLGGSRAGAHPSYAEAARVVGRDILRGWMQPMLYGGGNVGLMGLAAQAAKEEAERLGDAAPKPYLIGVIPSPLMPRELSGDMIGDVMYVPETMSERKTIMLKHCTAILALPGGFGTFDELMEYLTLFQLSATRVTIGLVNANHFFDPFVAHLQHLVREGFAEPSVLESFFISEDIPNFMENFKSFHPKPSQYNLPW